MKKIMTSYVESHNFNAEYHNISTKCYNFFRKKGIFSSFKILNEKVELRILNMHSKVVVM